jgi:glycosyltransferase involved in cell wall biosynthesis
MSERLGEEPQLSICIPTYNRCGYLEQVLAALAPIRARVDAEIVVSDDASSDDTAEFLAGFAAREPRVRLYRQPKRIGGFANTIFVLRAARGRFTVYHGDDDRLAEDGLVDALAFLEAHPGYAALYAPVEGYDLATNRSLGYGLYTEQAFDFDHERRIDLIAYVSAGLTPEHAVYRTAGLASVIHDPQIYWSLSLLDAALRAGTIRFVPKPFYRAIQSHWPGERRDQMFQGLMADIIAWETFRSGLEAILAAQPGGLAQRERFAQARAQIDRTLAQRQGVALDFLSAQRRWVEFVHIYRVLAMRGALPRAFPTTDLLRISLQAVAALISDYRALHGFGRVILAGLGDTAGVLVDMLDIEPGVVSTAPDLAATGAPGDDTLLVVADRAMADAALGCGYWGHAVRDFAALFAAYDLTSLTPAS